MSSETFVTVREARPDDLAAARRVIATAFAGEPFAFGMFGESSIDRLVGMTGEYAAWPSASNAVAVVAEASGVVIGSARATLPGECHLCDTFDASVPPGPTPAERIEHEFKLNCRTAHLGQDLPPHAHLATVAVEPFLQGTGVGRRIVADLIARVRGAGAECAVLECLTTRESFYRRAGFHRTVEFDDPGAAGLRAVLMRIDLGGGR